MKIERAPGGASLIDVLDRVLDKGIVIDAWVRVSLAGIKNASTTNGHWPGLEHDEGRRPATSRR